MAPDMILIVAVGCSAGLLLLLLFALLMYKVSWTSHMMFPTAKHTYADLSESLVSSIMTESPLTHTFWNGNYYSELGNKIKYKLSRKQRCLMPFWKRIKARKVWRMHQFEGPDCEISRPSLLPAKAWRLFTQPFDGYLTFLDPIVEMKYLVLST